MELKFDYNEAFGDAIMNGRLDVVKMYLALQDFDPNADTYLHMAIRYNRHAILKELLKHPRIDVKQAIMQAVIWRNINMLKTLLEHPGINVNYRLPLLHAASRGDLEIMRVLMQDSRTKINHHMLMSSSMRHPLVNTAVHLRHNVLLNRWVRVRAAINRGVTLDLLSPNQRKRVMDLFFLPRLQQYLPTWLHPVLPTICD